MKRGRLTILMTAITPVVGLLLLFTILALQNDQKLAALTNRFLAYPLPPETHHADYAIESSIALRGNGNHCDYQVTFSLSTSLSEAEIVSYYDKAYIRGVEAEQVSIAVYFARVPDQVSAGGSPVRTFLLRLFDSSDAGLDLRCH